MNSPKPSIFSQEEAIIQAMDAALADTTLDETTQRKNFKTLLTAYKRLFKQLVRLIKLSDRQQKELRDLDDIKNNLLTQLERLSCTDGLTGIPNRRYFDNYFGSEWLRAQRISSPLSLIMMDVDYFKPFNDHYGHAAGDKCLQQVATIIASTISRPADIVARYGGEEFICVLPETDQPGAETIAQRIIQEMALRKIPHQYSQVQSFVTLSLGVATAYPHQGGDAEALMKQADRLLYQAKATGRNQYQAQLSES